MFNTKIQSHESDISWAIWSPLCWVVIKAGRFEARIEANTHLCCAPPTLSPAAATDAVTHASCYFRNVAFCRVWASGLPTSGA